MTIIIPRDMPETGTSVLAFEPQRIDYQAPEAGGRLGGVQAGFPLWLATWTIGKIGEERSDLWRAWHARMRGSQRRFLGRDMRRPFPKLYPKGFTGMTRPSGGAFDGSAAGFSVFVNAEDDCVVELFDLPENLTISIGDYLGFKWDDPAAAPGNRFRRALVRAVLPTTVTSIGYTQLMVEPPVPNLVPSNAVAHFDRPACVMAMGPESRLEGVDRRGAIRGGTIVGVQDLRA
jgi:hypothetical protein